MAGQKYDPKQAYGPVVITDVINMNLENLVELSDGIYEYGALLNHYYVNNYIPKPGDPDPFNMTIIGSSLGGAPVTVTQCYDGTNEILFRIGSETTPYVPDEGHNITLKYSALNLVPYGKIEIPHLKIHKESPIDDEWWEEDIVLTPAEWVIPAGGAYLTHEYKMARILSEEATQPIEILSKSRTDLTIVKETKGSREVAFQINTTIPPTEDVTCRVRYQIPSSVLCNYWLEYSNKAYNLNLCGDKIEILKNGVLDDVTLEECTIAGVPVPELEVGDKYIDFSFILADGSLKHSYLPVKDLFDPYVGYQAIAIEYVTDPTDPDYKKNRVKLLINQVKNDRKKDGTTAHDPLNPELITNPTLVQDTDGLYIKDATENNFGATIYATRNVTQYLADGTGDEVLDPTAANIPKTVKPLDLLDFLKYSKSVDPSLKWLYERDETTHEHFNKTMIDAFNEVASVKIDTQGLKTSAGATPEEKAAYIEAYRLYTTPDPTTTTKHFLGDKIYDYREIVPTTTLKPSTDGPLYPSQVNEYTLYYLNQREAKGTTPETYDEVGFYLWSTLKGFYPVGGKDIRGKEAIGIEWIPEDTINEVSLLINEYKNDENLEILPDGTLVNHNPVLIQKKDEDDHEGLYAAHAYRAEIDITQDPPVVIPRQWGVTTFASEDQVLDAEEKNLAVSPLDLHTFVNDSESVKDDLKHLYRVTGQPYPYNKTVIDAINEVASTKIIDTKIQSNYPVIEPTEKEKKIYSTRYNLYRTPREDDPYFRDFLVNSDAIYDYKEVVQTSTLRNFNAVSNPDGLYPEQKNDYSLYYLDTEDVIGTTTYKVGLYMWRLEDPTDPASGKFFPVGRDPIIDTKDLPVDPDIDQNFFYRTRTYYEVEGRYDISEDAKLGGYKLNKDGLVLPDGTIVDYTTVYANWSTYYGTNKPLVAVDSGRLFKVTDKKDPSAPVTALYYNFNASPVSLLFHDEVTDKWVDVIPKYKVLNDFKDADGNIIPGNEWEIYVLLDSTTDYAAGIYIWDRHDYIPISSKGTAIIDVAELPTVGIEDESFYRTHNNYTIDSRHSLTEQAKKDGYKLSPVGIETATTLIPWSAADIAELTTNGIIEPDTAGEIFVVTDKDVTPEVTKVYYNFNSTPVELHFHDPINDKWIEMISKYKAVNDLKSIADPQEWQIYVQLNDTSDFKEGIYIWDGGNFKSISSKTEVIIDKEELPETDIEENSFYRTHPRNKEEVVERYGLKDTDHARKFVITPNGVESDYYGVAYTYAQILQYFETTAIQDILTVSPTGEIYKIVTDPEATTPEYNLVYKYHTPETTLEFHDEEQERWVDLINKVHFLDTFEGVTGEDYEVYYLTYSYDKYVSGLFYWDGAQFVPFEKYPQSMFYYTKYEVKPETYLPDYRTATPGVYVYDEHEGFGTVNWAFTPEAEAQGYHISDDFSAIVAPDGTSTELNAVYVDHDIWETNNILTRNPEDGYTPFNEVVIFVNDDPASIRKTMVYNYTGQSKSINIPTENGWKDVYRNYIAVNTLPQYPEAEKLYYFVDEITATDGTKYPKGLYIFRNGKWFKTGSDTIQVVKELPETQQDSFFNIHNDYIIEGIYGLTKQAVKDGYKISVDGITKPDGDVIAWTDAVLADLITDGVLVGDAEGQIYNVKIGEEDYKLYYNFNSSPAELHYYEESLEGYTDILNRYKAVNNLEGIPDEERYEWQIYVQLNDTDEHDAGVYIWDSRRFIPISSKGEAIIDVDELPTEIRETSFYRMYNTAVVAKDDSGNILRYKVLDEEAYMLADDGLVKKEDGSVTPWEEVLTGWDETYGVLFQRVDNGDLFKILVDPDATEKEYKLIYKFYEPKTLLKFHDEKNDRWIDLLSKFKVVNTFAGVLGEEYELYILTESTEGYAQGMYYFDRDKFVPVNKTANAVMFLDGSKENLPDPIKAEDVVYGWKADITRDPVRSWKFTDEAIELGYTVNSTYTAIVDPEGNETVFDDVYADIETWEQDVLTLDTNNGPFNLVKVTLPDGTQRSTIMYRYIKQDSVSVTDHVKWYDLYSQYVPVNDLNITEPDGAKLYLLMQDWEDYQKGLYYYNGVKFSTILESGGIILCEELPIAGIQERSVYELHTKIEDTIVTNYDLTIVEKDAGSYLDVYGLHTFDTSVTPPVENPVVCFADMFAQWDEYIVKFSITLPEDPKGPIWEYQDPVSQALIRKWSTVTPILPEDRVQFYVYNAELDKWLLLDDTENTINEVRDWDLGKQDSDTLNITWEGTQAEYEALTELNSKTIYFVYDGEAMPAPQQSYNALLDRPTINNVLLQGDLSLQDIGIQTFQYKGAVETAAELPLEENKPGDMYSVLEDNSLYAWNGVEWSRVAHDLVDLSKYQTIEDEDLMTEAKEIVPAINELYEKMGTPEKITFKLTNSRPGSMLGACHGTFNPSTYTATISMEITDLGIEDEGTFDLGRVQMSTTEHGALIPTGIQALNSVDADAFTGETTGFATTNVGIDTLGNIKCRAIMGASTITSRGTHTTEQAIIKTLVLSGTIYITE